ncbi:alpha/beta fold hydrolase [Zobellia alginiliquefaciens]|uniref:alpha/beta fold hydrolase n=1 Tax=Zobellia alginiliquefaciens TaxID=3032586 RepID=UPI0023E4106A|nr:alpha/beta hydrolase [Zobellia alginiliquefaciens]
MSNTLYDDKKSSSEPITVIFLHGNSLSSLVWSNQLSSTLFEKVPLVALDLPGHGKSPEYDSYAFANLLKGLRENIEIYERVIVVGHSLGGHLAIQLLPKLTNCLGLFIVGTPPLNKPVNPEEAFLPDPRMGLFFQRDLGASDIEAMIQVMVKNTDDGVLNYKKLIQTTDPKIREALALALVNGELANEVDILSKSNIPVAVAIGATDKLVNTEYVKGLSIPFLWRGAVQIIENSAHIPQLDASFEFSGLLLEFINSVENE